MAKIQCKMCGGLNDLPDGVTSGECVYCGSLTTFPKIDDEQMERLYARAEHFRRSGGFDKAVAAYEAILGRNGEDPEAWWGLLISKYGIEYVEDPATHERIPTCHRVQFDSILADSDYLNALKYAVGSDRDIYEREARRIFEIQKGILRISAQEKPYDVFICYKETTDGGTRTKDSTLAQDIYYQLTNQGLKVFFSRITLEHKLGQQYEPYIFAALNSSKVMLVIGSKKEYFEAVWVKNEWSRYLALMKKDSTKLLIPCYRDMDPYDIPEELSMFQCQDMGKIGFIQDILHGIMKVVNAGGSKAKVSSASASGSSGSFELAKLMRRISILMEQQDWGKAREVCDTGLNIDPENPELYLMLCMITRRIPGEDALRSCGQNLSVDKNFRMAMKFAPPERKKKLETIRQDATSGFFLKKCMDAKNVSDVSRLSLCSGPLNKDENFQNALNSATPEFREKLLQIRYDQAERFLDSVRRRLGVVSLEQSRIPLGSDEQFLTAMSLASDARRKELEGIQKAQTDFYLHRCMEANRVADVAALAECDAPLAEDENFKTAFLCASPERKKELVKLQQDQVEFFVRKCMERCKVSAESELFRGDVPLCDDVFFRRALKFAVPERKEQLKQIQFAQSDEFLRKCVEAHHASDAFALAFSRKSLRGDPLFLAAQDNASSKQAVKLAQIAARQQERIAARRARRNMFIALGVVFCLVLIGLVYFNRLTIGAALGGAEAKYKLARRYEEGDGVKLSFSSALNWYRKAAEKGHAESQYRLALAYERGEGVSIDHSEAAKWYLKAAEQGHLKAQMRLGETFEKGYGVLVDYSEAAKWYRKAAAQGDADARRALDSLEMVQKAQNGGAVDQFKLAQAYENGSHGLNKDVAEAAGWYRKAAEQGHADAQIELGRLCADKGSYAEAAAWYRKAAERGHDGAPVLLGRLYENGDGVEKDLAEAARWYFKAVKQGRTDALNNLRSLSGKGDSEAQFLLAQAYENGYGPTKDLIEAIKWYGNAAEQGHAEAFESLLCLAAAGNVNAKERLEITYLVQRSSNGDREAQFNLAQRYETGNGVMKDLFEAVKRYRKVAEQGHAGAQYELGRHYENGDGVKKNLAEAAKWYRKAAEQGHAEAKAALAVLGPLDLSGDATEITVIVPGGVSWKMVKIEAGMFEMSARDGENDSDEVEHRATLTKDFYIGQTEVTQAQWKAVMGNNPSQFKGDDLPVENVSWKDAMEFCGKLNSMWKVPGGWKFSLPTETQWEYAARGGNRNKGYKYSGSDSIGDVAWYNDNSGSKTHPVGKKKANELGLYDMSGNVWEWCLDDYVNDSSKQRAEFTRGNDSAGSNRVARGGGWGSDARGCRSAYRYSFGPGFRLNSLGFRVALVPESY